MVRRTKEDAQETRNRILDTAVEVFSRQGVAQTSLNAIAKEAGVTRGAIYWHFANKVSMFDAMIERLVCPLMINAEDRDARLRGDEAVPQDLDEREQRGLHGRATERGGADDVTGHRGAVLHRERHEEALRGAARALRDFVADLPLQPAAAPPGRVRQREDRAADVVRRLLLLAQVDRAGRGGLLRLAGGDLLDILAHVARLTGGLLSIVDAAGDFKDLNGYMQADQTRVVAFLCHTTAQKSEIAGILGRDITDTASTGRKIDDRLKSAELIVMSR